jgi:hypothetical protein
LLGSPAQWRLRLGFDAKRTSCIWSAEEI